MVLRLRWGETGWRKLRPKKLKTNSQKCWMKTQYCEFGDPAIAMGEIGWRKLQLKKSNWLFWFSQPQFSSLNFPHHNRRILEFVILCLRPTFLRIYPLQLQEPRTRNIVSSSNSFENFKFSKLLMGGNWWRKSRPKKLKRTVRFFAATIFIN